METVIVGHGPVDGYPITSFRAELFGVWSVLIMTSILLKLMHNVTALDLEIFCDNKSAVNLICELAHGRDLPSTTP